MIVQVIFACNSEYHSYPILDDNELSAKQRLGLFKQNTLPMLKHLDDKGKLRVVRKDEDKVWQNPFVPILSARIVCLFGVYCLIRFRALKCNNVRRIGQPGFANHFIVLSTV